jgi:hypothetical protein
MSITDRINNNLSAIFNTDDDEIFKALVNDKDGNIPGTINKPTDIDIGVIGSQIEYLRQLSITLLKQMYMDQQDTEFLEFTLNNYFDSLQLRDETEAEWLQRVINNVFSQKVSQSAIIFLMRPYSPGGEPEITNIIVDNAFADLSYCDIYSSGETTLDGDTIPYLAAIADTSNSAFFTIKVTLYDTPYAEIFTVQDVLNNIVAAGIDVVLQIIYT